MSVRPDDPTPTVEDSSLGDAATAGAAAAEPLDLTRPTAIGRFVIERRLGGGGMGVVYLAHDPTLARNVAVKLIRPGLYGQSEIRRVRLLREAQALGKVIHPHVVTVHEAGTVGDEVYVAMEYVDGGTLGAWLAGGRSRREILGAFVAAGRGLAAAHAAGLVHRDFKPENVLVGKDGRVRVTDFGLAGVTGGGETDALGSSPLSGLTTPGAVLGTPRYMAPEQHMGGSVDARADQFAFAVALHEALAGQPPFAGDTVKELRQNVLEENVRPLPDSVPRRIRGAVRRALSRDPRARWPSMTALCAALEARPLLTAPRLAAAAGIVALAALGGWATLGRRETPCRGAERKLAGVWDDAVRGAARANFLASGRPDASDTFARTGKALDAYAAGWTAMHTEACEATAVRREQSDAALDQRMRCLDGRLGELRALAGILVRDPGAVAGATKAALGLDRVEDCADLKALAASEPSAPAAIRLDVEALRQKLQQMSAYHRLGNHAQALALAEPVVAEARKLGYAPLLASALYLRGGLVADGDPKAAEADFTEAVGVAADAGDEVRLAKIQVALMGLVGVTQQRRAEALAMRPMVEASVRRAGNTDAIRCGFLTRVGLIYLYDGQYQPALDGLAAAQAACGHGYGDGSLEVARVHSALAKANDRAKRLDEAQRHAERALAIFEKELGPDAVDTGEVVNTLGILAAEAHDLDGARQKFERALAIAIKQGGPTSARAATLTYNLGLLLKSQGKYADARPYLEKGLALREKILGSDHPEVALALLAVAECVRRLDGPAAGEPLLVRALAIQERRLPPEHIDLTYTLDALGDLLIKLRPDGAVPLIERALAIREKVLGQDAPDTFITRAHVADAYLAANRPADALRQLERAEKSIDDKSAPDAVESVRFLLGQTLRALRRDPARSRDLVAKARASAVARADADRVAEIDAWLARGK